MKEMTNRDLARQADLIEKIRNDATSMSMNAIMFVVAIVGCTAVPVVGILGGAISFIFLVIFTLNYLGSRSVYKAFIKPFKLDEQ